MTPLRDVDAFVGRVEILFANRIGGATVPSGAGGRRRASRYSGSMSRGPGTFFPRRDLLGCVILDGEQSARKRRAGIHYEDRIHQSGTVYRLPPV